MKQSVFNTRTKFCCLILAAVLCNFIGVMPAEARVEISVGQAGDPGDGFGVQESGGTATETSSATNQVETDGRLEVPVVLVPVYTMGGMLVFQVVLYISHALFRKTR